MSCSLDGTVPEPESIKGLQTSPFGVIPKTHKPGQLQKWHLIVDLSAPQGQSVNDGIKPELCSLSYPSVEEAACSLGPHALMPKLDLKNAYRMVPVHAEDRHLLAVKWKEETCGCCPAIWAEVSLKKFLRQWQMPWCGFYGVKE